MTQALKALIKRLLNWLLTWTVGLFLLFEEWGWHQLASLMSLIGRLPGLRWIEARIRELPPRFALALFALPILSLLPLKILALYWLGHGHAVLGVAVILTAKVLGTALGAWLYNLTQATLMRLPWFARWHARWMAFKDALLAQLKSGAAWQSWLRARAAIRQVVKAIRARLPF
jgi:hypothetical protein